MWELFACIEAGPWVIWGLGMIFSVGILAIVVLAGREIDPYADLDIKPALIPSCQYQHLSKEELQRWALDMRDTRLKAGIGVEDMALAFSWTLEQIDLLEKGEMSLPEWLRTEYHECLLLLVEK